jgi:hypothetical protein
LLTLLLRKSAFGFIPLKMEKCVFANRHGLFMRFGENCRNGNSDSNPVAPTSFCWHLGVGPRTRNHLRNSVKALFNFGMARRYLPKDHVQFVELTRRVNEKRRAAWAKANRVSDGELKAADRAAAKRLAKLTRNQRRSRGTVMPGAETAEDEGWKALLWKHKALRHSFISYRVAQTQNVAQVALEAGNSPQMIFRHYRELVRPADAKMWFSLAPGKGRKIIPFTTGEQPARPAGRAGAARREAATA